MSPYGYTTPEILRTQSLQYVPALFARHVFPREEQRVLGPDGKLQFFINSLGYRGELFSIEKPAGTTRIIIYGGSAAFDSSASEGHAWPYLVGVRLHESGFPNAEV